MYSAYHCFIPSAEVTSFTSVFAISTTSCAADVVTFPKTSVMNDSRSPSNPLALVDPLEEPADAVACGIKSEEMELKNEEMALMAGRESCLAFKTGVGAVDSRGMTARAVTEAAFSTLIAFCRMVEVFS
jgi:hypothetical protein